MNPPDYGDYDSKVRRHTETLLRGGATLPNDRLISDTHLSHRAKRVCRLGGIRTMGDLRSKTEVELLRIVGCGRATLFELKIARSTEE